MNSSLIKSSAAVATAISLAVLAASPISARVAVVQAASPALAPGSSYAWAPVNAAAVRDVDPAMANPIVEARLRAAVDTAMASHGYRRAASPEDADLVVSYFVALQHQLEVKARPVGGSMVCGWRGCLRGYPTTVDIKRTDYTQGSLVLDLVDRRSGDLVWRATSNKRVSSKDVSQSSLNQLVIEMTKSLPTS